MFVECPIFVRQGRGVLHTPHKTTRRGRSYLSMGRCFYPCGIHVGRMQYAPTLPAGDVSYLYPQRLPRTRHFLLLDLPFSMSPCRGVLNTPHKRPEGAILSIYRSPHLSLRDTYGAYAIRPYPTGRRYFYRDCHQIFSGIHPFLVLIQEKDAKRKSRHQGCQTIWPGTGMGRQGYRGIWPRTRPSRF